MDRYLQRLLQESRPQKYQPRDVEPAFSGAKMAQMTIFDE